MPPPIEGEEPRRLSVGGESRIVDASSSTAWTGETRPTAGQGDDAATAGPATPEPLPASAVPESVTPQPPDSDAAETADSAATESTVADSHVNDSAVTDSAATDAAAVGSATADDGDHDPAGSRARQLAEIAAASRPNDDGVSGNTTVLVRTAIPAGSGPAPVDAGVVYVGSRRTERLTMIVSTVLGTLGLLLAVAAAGLDQVRYNQPAPCAAYSAAHHGAVAFGCTATASRVAVFLPAIGIPVLVLLALIVTWVPNWLPKARFGLLAGLFGVLLVCAVAVALAYSALPKLS